MKVMGKISLKQSNTILFQNKIPATNPESKNILA